MRGNPDRCRFEVVGQVYHYNPRWYTCRVPTMRPRHQISETPAVAHALDMAVRHWPGEPRPKLLLRLIQAGGNTPEEAQNERVRERRAAVEAVSGKYAGVFGHHYLAELRRDWPE